MATKRWIPIPEGALPGQYRVGDHLKMPDGQVVRITARSTVMLLVRRSPWWNRVPMWSRS